MTPDHQFFLISFNNPLKVSDNFRMWSTRHQHHHSASSGLTASLFSLSSRQESFPAKAVSLPDTEDQSMMGRFLRVERQVRGGMLSGRGQTNSGSPHLGTVSLGMVVFKMARLPLDRGRSQRSKVLKYYNYYFFISLTVLLSGCSIYEV